MWQSIATSFMEEQEKGDVDLYRNSPQIFTLASLWFPLSYLMCGADSHWDVVFTLSESPPVVCFFSAELTLFSKPPGVFLGVGRWWQAGVGYACGGPVLGCPGWITLWVCAIWWARAAACTSITGDQVTVRGFFITVTDPNPGPWQEAESPSSYSNRDPVFISLFFCTCIWVTEVSVSQKNSYHWP